MHIQTINPTDGSLIQNYDLFSDEKVSRYLESATMAFQSWRAQPFSSRRRCMNALATLLEQHKEDCAHLISLEMGKPITESRLEIDKCMLVCHHYAEHAENYLSDRAIQTDYSASYVSYKPIGAILAIMPWNFPFWQVFRFAAPNLMAGNVALLKHAPISTGAGLKIEALFREAGFPMGTFQTLVIDEQAAAKVIADPRVAGVTLTGSERAGRAVSETAGRHLKKVVMELGGSDPYLILKDADLELAAQAVVRSRFNDAGQVCIAAKRIIVDKCIKDDFLSHLQTIAREYTLGDPMDDHCTMGPLARGDLRMVLDEQVQTSIRMGALRIMGCSVPEGDGFYYPPSILDNVKQGMPAFEQELFGPVISVISANDEDEGIRLANASPYGLGAAVFTKDVARGDLIARDRLEAGACFVNSFVVSDPRLPFGGTKLSGYGRELSAEGIREFMNIKSVVVK